MSAKTATRNRTHVMVTLPEDLRVKVEKIALAEDRPMTSVCRLLIIDGLQRMNTPTTQHFTRAQQ